MIARGARTASRGLYLGTLAGEHRRFREALSRPAETQRRVLERTVLGNAGTEYLGELGLDQNRPTESFLARAPLTTYEDYRRRVERMRRGIGGVLTAEEHLCLHPTSGTGAASKLIPFTPALAREFRRGIGPWFFAQATRHPALIGGAHYWSISPPGETDEGFLDDGEYLGPVGRLSHVMSSAVPPSVVEKRGEEFFVATMARLILRRDLRFVSVWSPTFLTSLMGFFFHNTQRVIDACARLPVHGGARRAREVAGLIRESGPAGATSAIWPELRVISCWTHGASAPYAEEVSRLFSRAEIEPKGLLATEAFVSLPFARGMDPVLAVGSHFFELEDRKSGELRLAHELEVGGVYSVVVTTGGGLYRYRLGDLLEVTGKILETPTLRFLGRDGLVSDHTGEKISSFRAEAVLGAVLGGRLAQASTFRILAPTRRDGRLAYTLFVAPRGHLEADPARLADELEEGLSEEFHYALSRQTGQLTAPRIFVIDESRRSAVDVYCELRAARGARLGDVKIQPLHREIGLDEVFAGRFERLGERGE